MCVCVKGRTTMEKWWGNCVVITSLFHIISGYVVSLQTCLVVFLFQSPMFVDWWSGYIEPNVPNTNCMETIVCNSFRSDIFRDIVRCIQWNSDSVCSFVQKDKLDEIWYILYDACFWGFVILLCARLPDPKQQSRTWGTATFGSLADAAAAKNAWTMAKALKAGRAMILQIPQTFQGNASKTLWIYDAYAIFMYPLVMTKIAMV